MAGGWVLVESRGRRQGRLTATRTPGRDDEQRKRHLSAYFMVWATWQYFNAEALSELISREWQLQVSLRFIAVV